MAKLMKGDKGYFDKAMSLLAVFLGILPAVVLLVLWNSIPQSIPAHWFGDFVDRWGAEMGASHPSGDLSGNWPLTELFLGKAKCRGLKR